METKFTFQNIKTLILMFAGLMITSISPGQTTHDVSVANYAFSPSQLTITVGDMVVWTNNGGTHNVNGTQTTFPGNPESFGNAVGAGWTYQFVFNIAGTYNYHCDPHAAFGMTGVIVVNPKSTTAISKLDSGDNLVLYPNPANEFMQLVVPNNYERINSLKIYSITGALIDQRTGNMQSFRYNISNFKSGVYLMEINSNTQKKVLKFIKQ